MGANLDGHLVDVFQPFPPFIAGSQSHLTNNLSGRSMGQSKRQFWAPGNAKKKLMFTLRKACKSFQAAICLEKFYNGWPAEIAQQTRSHSSLQIVAARTSRT